MVSTPGAAAPIYREHDLFGAAALPVLAGVYDVEGDGEVHGHDFLEIAVIGGGSGRHVCAQGTTTLRPGMVFVLRPGAWHGFAGCRGLVVANACVSVSALRADLAFLREDPGVRDLLWTGPLGTGRQGVLRSSVSSADADEAVAAITALHDRLTERPTHRVLLLGHLLDVLGRLVGAIDPADAAPPAGRSDAVHPGVVAAAGRLEAAPEHPWRLDELAAVARLDPAYLTRLFRRHLGVSPLTYLARQRAERAAGLLARTDLPVARVGTLVGWPDPTYFARRFRSLVGLTPTEYRQRLTPKAGTHE